MKSVVKLTLMVALCIPFVQAVQADWVPQGTIVRIEVERGGETGVGEWVFEPGTIHVGRAGSLLVDVAGGDDAREIRGSGGNLLAAVQLLEVEYIADPVITLNFTVTAIGATTNFTITSASLGVGLDDPDAVADVSIGVTDNNGNGASLSGNFNGGGAYRATYNSGSVFTELASPILVSPSASGSGEGRYPALPTVRTPIAGTVNDMQAQFKFSLTAGDSASGTSRYEIVPEPASLALLGIGSAVMFLRRRR